jgi:hypothetical protein
MQYIKQLSDFRTLNMQKNEDKKDKEQPKIPSGFEKFFKRKDDNKP